MADLARILAPITRRISNLLVRGSVSAINAASKMQTLQVRLLAGEIKDGIEWFEQYGLTAHPKAGAEVLAAFFDGDRSHGVVLCVADRRYRLQDLKEGEVALYDDLGQCVLLGREGIVIKGAGLPVTITDTPKLRIEADQLECTGQITDLCDGAGSSMAAIRAAYAAHTHSVSGNQTNPTDRQI